MDETAEIESGVQDLYRAFCFDADGMPDWETLRAMSADGASYFSPYAPGSTPQGVGLDRFLGDFRSFIEDSPLGRTGYHERVIHARIDRFGSVAHAYVTFEGFVPGEPADRVGLDSIQFLASPTGWQVASFSTQYEGEGLPLPDRFRPER